MADLNIGGYRLIKNMATGMTSQVWEVVEDSSGRHFAMKLLLPEKIEDGISSNFLLHEAEVGISLAHDNIIRIMRVVKNPENPFFLMEFFPAGSLKLRIKRKEVDFIREKGADILKQMATGLAFMNAKGWVHRDIKPDNVLVNSAGQTKLIDFAIAQKIPTGWSRYFWRKSKPQGTRSYMSPEQIRSEPLDGRSDIYSFGISAYELFTGKTPFSGANSNDLLNKHLYEKPVPIIALNPEISKEFSDFVSQMLAKKKEERPKDFHAVLMRLREIRIYKPEEKKTSK